MTDAPSVQPKRRVPTPLLVLATLCLTIGATILGGAGAEGPASAILMTTRGLFVITGLVAGGRALAGAVGMLRVLRTADQETTTAAAVDVLGNSMIAWLVAGIVLRAILDR